MRPVQQNVASGFCRPLGAIPRTVLIGAFLRPGGFYGKTRQDHDRQA